jgi:tetratricopeptide (TPR) repeat protein
LVGRSSRGISGKYLSRSRLVGPAILREGDKADHYAFCLGSTILSDGTSCQPQGSGVARRKKKSSQITAAEPAASRSRLSPWLGLILLATFAAYLPALNGGVLWDDDANLTKPELQSIGGLFRIWAEPGATQQYYPLVHSAFWFEHKLWGDATIGYHLANVLWHMVSVVLVYIILTRLKIPGALLAAAIFALHPVMVESVAWITEQKNTLSGMFYLGAILAYLWFDESRKPAHYFLAMLLFTLALFGKTATVTLPAAVLVILWWKRGTLSWRRDLLPTAPLFLLAVFAGLVTCFVEWRHVGAYGQDFEFSFLQRLLLAGRAIWFYLFKLVWPANLIFMYPRWVPDTAQWWQWIFPVAAIATTAALWATRKRSRAPLAAWLFFCGTLLPMLPFLNQYLFLYTFVSDHFQYLASLGIIALVSAGVANGIARWNIYRLGVFGCTALLIVLALLTAQQSRMYADKATLYTVTLARNPTCWLAELNLGALLTESGNDAEAFEHLNRAIAVRPQCSDAYANIGIRLVAQGKVAEGIEHLQHAVQLDPLIVPIRLEYANALVRAKRYDDAITECQEAVRLAPSLAVARLKLGAALALATRYEPARAQLVMALQLQPDYPLASELLSKIESQLSEKQ